MLVLGVIGVSFSSIFVRYAAAPSVVTAAFRLLWTVILMTPVVAGKKTVRNELFSMEKKNVILSCFSGFFLAVHFVLWFESLNHTTVASSISKTANSVRGHGFTASTCPPFPRNCRSPANLSTTGSSRSNRKTLADPHSPPRIASPSSSGHLAAPVTTFHHRIAAAVRPYSICHTGVSQLQYARTPVAIRPLKTLFAQRKRPFGGAPVYISR